MKVVIIGGVAAGMSTAAKLKRNLGDDVDITVYEKGDEVSYGACGLPFYISDVIKEGKDLFAKSVQDFQDSGINLQVFHEVLHLDQKNKKLEVKNLKTNEVFEDSYDKLIVGTGTRLRPFNISGEHADNVIGVHSVHESSRIKQYLQDDAIKDVVIIGAGFVGMEMLEACKTYNKNVTIIHLRDRLFTIMDEDFSVQIEDVIKEKNIKIIKNAETTGFHLQDDKVVSVVYKQDGKEVELSTDLLISAIGTIPNTEFIKDVKKASNGAIEVNEHMQTSDPDIYAAGDASIMKSAITNEYSYAPLGTNANKQGRIIADVLAGKKPKPFKLIHSTALKLFDYDVAKIGVSEQQGLDAGMKVKSHTIVGNSYASYYSKEKLTIRVVYEEDTRKIVGVQCFGQGDVVPRANYYAIAIYSGLTVDEMGMMDLAYSPPFNGVWDAALIASNTIK